MFDIATRNKASISIAESENSYTVTLKETSPQDFMQFTYTPKFEMDTTDFVFMPACCYDGNRTKMRPMPVGMNLPNNLDFPPDQPVHGELTMRELPGLKMDNGGILEMVSGDCSVPCIGIWSRKTGKAVLLFTVQEINRKNVGLVYEKGKMSVRFPYYREFLSFQGRRMQPSIDELHDFYKGDVIKFDYRIIEFDCTSMERFFRVFFENRKCMGLDSSLPHPISLEEQKEIQLRKFNEKNWNPELGFYGLRPMGMKGRHGQLWHPAWCGGIITAYALMKIGGELEKERGFRTLDFLFSTQTKGGIYHDIIIEGGKPLNYKYNNYEDNNWSLTRFTGDILYFLAKIFEICPEAVDRYLDKIKVTCDMLVRLWDKEHDFGQFIDKETGELALANSTSGANIPGGLLMLNRWFKNPDYERVAMECAEHYYTDYAAKGITCGGPGDALQTIDSESCAALLQSMVAVYEHTHEKKWLERSQHVCHLLASWTVPYNYRFPEDSQFARLGMKTIGTVYANLQNKHSAPGICTASPLAIWKIYEATGDKLYKDLFIENAITCGQFLSTKERPLIGRGPGGVRKIQPEGFMDEKVNMSDWSSLKGIGEINGASCWCETTNMLIIGDCADILEKAMNS